MHTVFALVVTAAEWIAHAWRITPLFWAWHLLTADFTAVSAVVAGWVLMGVAVLAVGWFRRPSDVDANAIEAGLRDPGDA